MNRKLSKILLSVLMLGGVGCAGGARPPEPVAPGEAPRDPGASTAETTPAATTPTSIGACDPAQVELSAAADRRADPWGIAKHLEKNFPDRKVSWLMKEEPYQTYVVASGAENFGRCNDDGCFLFAAPTPVIAAAVARATKEDGAGHDPALLGEALGLPAKNFEGPLRMMTLDLAATDVCVRLPIDDDPGVWKCSGPEDKDCFKFGGYTSGGIPEVMVINAPVAAATVQEIP